MAGGSARPDLRNSLNILGLVGAAGDLPTPICSGASDRTGCDLAGGPDRLGGASRPDGLASSCRQILGDSHDAEDAFQATFLILARKAGSVRKVESVAGWLHGVALRVAARTRANAARRKSYEQRAAAMKATESGGDERAPNPAPSCTRKSPGLPHRYREPVVLCYLEGLSTEAAAVRIGCPRGTVLSRLSRARDRLRRDA